MTMPPADPASLRGAVDLSSLVNRAASPATTADGSAPGAAGAPENVTLPGLIFDGTDANFGQFLELSMTVPVIVDLWAEWCQPCKQLTPVLEKLVAEFAGRLVLVAVDVDANPQLSQAFQAQSIPTVAALIGGNPAPLFAGAYPEAQVRDVFQQVLQLAAENGISGTVQVEGAGEAEQENPAEPVEEPLPPLHQEAYDATTRGDYPAAIEAYKSAIAQNPRDELAVAGLAQVSLLFRLQGRTLDEIRNAAAASPADADAQMAVADLDLSGGHIEDAFDRLLTLYPSLDADDKDRVRERLLELFEVAGATDPRVVAARRRLTMLLY